MPSPRIRVAGEDTSLARSRRSRGEGTPPTVSGATDAPKGGSIFTRGLFTGATLILFFTAAADLSAQGVKYPTPAEPHAETRGGRVGWARLITPNPAWDRHADSDATLSRFIRRETTLNIDPTWYTADPASVEKLCSYPLIFTNNLTDVRDAAHWKNLQEYLKRGGFIFVDACTNRTITADPDTFLQRHIELMARLVPGGKVRALPASHEIFRHYFEMTDTPPHTYMGNVYDPSWARHGLYGVFDGDRMVSLISLSGLQCGWAGMDGFDHGKECMKMVVNIYVYAMTR